MADLVHLPSADMGIILEVVALTLYQFLYHPPRFDQLRRDKTRWQQFKELDFIGMFLFIAGFVLFIVGLSWGGQAYAWDSAEVVATLVVGACTIVFFGIYETHICKGQPLMPPKIFTVGYTAIVACGSIGAMVYYTLTVIWPTIITSLYTTDVIEVGWKSAAVGGGILLGQTIGGIALTYVPRIKYLTIVASALGGGLTASLAAVSPQHESAAIAQAILACIFVGMVENITLAGVTLVCEDQDIGVAAGVLGSVRSMAGAIAQSLFLAIFTNKSTAYLQGSVPAAATDAGLSPDAVPAVFEGLTAGSFADVPGITPEIINAVGQAAQHAYSRAIYWTFIAAIPFAIILFISSMFVPNVESMLTGNVAKKLQGRGTKQAPESEESIGKEYS